jgi:hypothetical protein
MKKYIFFALALLLGMSGIAAGQSTIAQFIYEDAEQAFAKKDYTTALNKLEEAEQMLGKINPPILFLRIMVRHDKLKAAGDTYDYDDLELTKADASRYLQDYVTLDALRDPLRDVYRVSQELNKYPTRAVYEASIQERNARDAAAAEKERKLQAFMAREYAIGDTGPAGGLISYDKGSFTDGWRYLEIAPPGWSGSAKDPKATWGCEKTNVPETSKYSLGGKTKTAAILEHCPGENAARLAARHSVEVGGIVYNDWFLPSTFELGVSWTILQKGKFKHSLTGTYWTSNQDEIHPHTTAMCVFWAFGQGEGGYEKGLNNKVRPVRYVTPITPHNQEVYLGVGMTQTEKGVVVVELVAGHAAERAGVKTGDLLLRFDDEVINKFSDIVYRVRQKRPGDRALLHISREGEIMTVDVLFSAGDPFSGK